MRAPSKLCRARNLVRAEVLVQLAAIQILCSAALRLCGEKPTGLVVLEAARAEALHPQFSGAGVEAGGVLSSRFFRAAERRRPWSRARSPASGPPRRAPLPPGTGRDAEARKHGAAARQRFRCRALDILASSFSQRSSCSACRAALSATRLFKAQRPLSSLPVEEGEVISKMICLPPQSSGRTEGRCGAWLTPQYLPGPCE